MRFDRRPSGILLNATPTHYCHGNRSILPLAWFLLVTVTACEREPQLPAGARNACDENARLSTELYGAVRLDLSWTAESLTCQGMPRPDDEGARIHLSGPVNDGPEAATVAFILGIPDLETGRTAKELGTNVTFMEEGSGRFFGTRDTDSCWTDIAYQEVVPGAGGSTYRIGGTVYCVSPLAELNGGASISFTELEFAGRLNWDVPE